MGGQARRRRLTATLLAVLLVGASVVGIAGVASVVNVASADQHIRYVDEEAGTFVDSYCGPEDATNESIQDAVNASDPGDVIVVCDGTYDESVVIDKRLTIRVNSSEGPVRLNGNGNIETGITVGPSADGTVVEGNFDGPSDRQLVIEDYDSAGVKIEGASDVTVTNTTFDELDGPAVDVRNASGVSVTSISVTDSSGGIATDHASAITVTDGSFQQLSGPAVDLANTTEVSVTGAAVTTSPVGVSATDASEVAVTDTRFERLRGPAVDLTDTAEVVVRGTQMLATSRGVFATSSEGVTVADARFDLIQGGPSVEFANVSGSSVRGGRVANGSRGVVVRSSSGVAVVDTRFDGSAGASVNATGTDDTVVRNVTVREGSGGVLARGGTNVTVRGSTFDGHEGTAVNLTGTAEALVQGVEVGNATSGIVAIDTPDLRVADVRVDRVDGVAVDVTDASGAVLRDLRVSNGSAGVAVRTSSNATVEGGAFTDLTDVAVEVGNADGALVRDVDVRNARTGVAYTATGSGEFSNVTVRNTTVANGTNGVRVDVTEGARLVRLTVSGLDLSGNEHGIGLFASDSDTRINDVIVEESTIEGSTTRGVEVSTVDSSPRIEGVTMRNLTVDGAGTGEGVYLSAQGAGVLDRVTLRDSTVASHDVGVTLRSESVLRNTTVLRNRVTDTERGVLLDGEGTRPLRNVGVRQNLVRNGDTGVFVTDGTDARELRVTRNVIRDNTQGVVNEDGRNLAAWLNYWGADSGPSGGEEDPRTGIEADGTGDEVSENVRFDPWLGKGACSDPGVRNVSTGAADLYGAPVELADLRSFCAWDRAPVSLRPDTADAALTLDNLDLSYELEGVDGSVDARRPAVEIYERDEPFELQFGAGSTDTSRFAGDDTQLIVVRGLASTNASFDVRFDERAGETVLRSDAERVSVRPEWGSLDEDGRLNESFEPGLAGSYTFVLVRPEFGTGLRNGSTRDHVRLDGGATVLGFETVVVRETAANATNTTTNATTANGSYPAGSEIPFELASNLPDSGLRIDHALLLYDESRFRNATATVTVDATAADVIAGEVSRDDVSVTSSVSDLNGFYRGDRGFARLGVDVAARSESGLVDPSPFLGLGTRLYDTTAGDPGDTADAAPLDGSVVVTRSGGPDTTVDVETFRNVSTGTYRYVYLAGIENGRRSSVDTGTVEITTPVATPTPAPGGGGDGGDGGDGGGGGGQPGGGEGGEVQIQEVALLNDTVTAGQPVGVGVDLANFDPVRGRITLNLTVDGSIVAERTVAVGASTERTVRLTTIINTPGTYAVGLGGRDLGTVTVAQAGTPTRTPSPTAGEGPSPTSTPTGGGPSTATASADPGTAEGGDGPGATATPREGPPPATGTETVIAIGLALLLLYGVGVAVYVLREHPPSGLT